VGKGEGGDALSSFPSTEASTTKLDPTPKPRRPTHFAAGVAGWNHYSSLGLLPAWLPAPPAIAIEPIQLTSFALSLLLVFRTNASYSRYQEARRWGMKEEGGERERERERGGGSK
jgi:hypothetical protein